MFGMSVTAHINHNLVCNHWQSSKQNYYISHYA